MPFYIRKAISLGPLRFNLSKSGIGISAGITGLRIGSGARGNYLHAGRGGLYYRKAIGGETVPTANMFGDLLTQRRSSNASPNAPSQPAGADGGSGQQFESGASLAMRDATASEFLDELNEKRKHRDSWPGFGIATLLVTAMMAYGGVSIAWWVALAVFGFALSTWRYQRDQVEKSAVSMYDLEPEVEASYKHLVDVFEKAISQSSVWHVEGETCAGGRRDRPTTSMQRKLTIAKIGSGPVALKTNIPVPQLRVGSQVLHFLPERILIEAPEGFGAVNYNDLQIDLTTDQFLERDEIPPAAKVVGSAWDRANRDGSPDLRFKETREIPIMEYERLHLRSVSGLNEVIQISLPGLGEEIRQAFLRLR